MEIIIGIIWDVILFVIPILCVILLGVLIFGIFRMGTSQGDAQRAAGARTTITTSLVALVLLPTVLVGFRVIFADIISPNTGVDAGVFERDCNRILMSQLTARVNVRSEKTVEGLARSIQSQVQECNPEFWLTDVEDDSDGITDGLDTECNDGVEARNGPSDLFSGNEIRKGGWICIRIAGDDWLYNPNNGDWSNLS